MDSENPDLPSHPLFFKLIRTMFWHTDVTRKKSVDETMWVPPYYRVLCTQKQGCPFPSPFPLFPQVQASCSAACTWWKKGEGGWGRGMGGAPWPPLIQDKQDAGQ